MTDKKKKVLTISKTPDIAAAMVDALNDDKTDAIKKGTVNDAPVLKSSAEVEKDKRKAWLSKNRFVEFWNSLKQGTYINPKNRKAVVMAQRRKDIVRTKGTKRLVMKHGKMVVKPITPLESKTKKHGDKKVNLDYYGEKNHLEAVANMLCRGTRKMRRNLCKKLGFRWSFYKEAEAMIMEMDEFSGFGFDAIKENHGIRTT